MLSSWRSSLSALIGYRHCWLLIGALGGLSAWLILDWWGKATPNAASFLFLSVLALGFMLYRPNWAFLVLIVLLPLENSFISPADWPLHLRPYQWWGALLLLALGLRLGLRRTAWPLFRFTLPDALLALLPLGAWISGLVFRGEGLRLAAVVTSYFALYVLGRIFFRRPADAVAALPFFLGSAVLVAIMAIGQNVLFVLGRSAHMVMAARPNATFSEPDWLGFFLVLALSATLAFLASALPDEGERLPLVWGRLLAGSALFIMFSVALLLTVSRSAWIAGALVAVLAIAGILIGRDGRGAAWSPERALALGQIIVVNTAISLLLVVGLRLTPFELAGRAASLGSGDQRITIACAEERALPPRIPDLAALVPLGCRHIDVEERESERAAGRFVTTIDRPDPNVVIRSRIYASVLEELRAHPVLGIGWGNIGRVLGQDATGHALNASNLWFELWLGSTLLGVLAFTLWLGVALWQAARTERAEGAFAALGFALGLAAFGVFNLFNAGLLLGSVWLLFALAPLWWRTPLWPRA